MLDTPFPRALNRAMTRSRWLLVGFVAAIALAVIAPSADATEACGLGPLLTCYIVGPKSPRPPRSAGGLATVSPSSAPLNGTFKVSMSGFQGDEFVQVWIYPPKKGPPSEIASGWASGGRLTRSWTATYVEPGVYSMCGQGQGSMKLACASFTVTGQGSYRYPPATPMISAGATPPSKVSNGVWSQVVAQTVVVGQPMQVYIGPIGAKEKANVFLYVNHGNGEAIGTSTADKDGYVTGRITTDATGYWQICAQGTKTRRSGCVGTWVVPAAFANGTPTGTNGATLNIVSKNLSATTMSAGGFTPGESIQLWLGAGPGVTDQSWRTASPVTADGAGNATFAAQWYYEDPMGPFAGCLVGATSGFAACSTAIPRGTSILDS